MQISNFDSIRVFLLDPSDRRVERRKEILQWILQGKIISGIAMGIFGLAGLTNLAFSVTSPFFKGFQLVVFMVGFFLSREVFVITKNAEKILYNKGPLLNITIKIANIFTPDYFVDSLFKDTLIAAPFFTSFLVEWLNRPKITSEKIVDLLGKLFI